MESEVLSIRERESTVARECFNKCTPPPPGGFSREGIVCAEESNERMICLHYVPLMKPKRCGNNLLRRWCEERESEG